MIYNTNLFQVCKSSSDELIEAKYANEQCNKESRSKAK